MVSLYTPQDPIVRPEPLRGAVLEGRVRPLSRSLALTLLDVCAAPAPWRIEAEIVPDAPANLAQLLDRWSGAGPVPVSGENAEDTVWGHPDLNALFRAWHDTLHVYLSRDVDLEGERAVALLHLRRVDSPADREVLWAETWGQAAAHAATGQFPRLQRAFVVAAVRFGIEEAVRLHREGRFA